MPQKKIFIVPPPVKIPHEGVSKIDRNTLLVKFGLPPKAVLFGAFGQILPNKRLDFVLKALTNLKKEVMMH